MSNKASALWFPVALFLSISCTPVKLVAVYVPAPKPEKGLKRIYLYSGKGDRATYCNRKGKIDDQRKVEYIDVGRRTCQGFGMGMAGCSRFDSYDRVVIGFTDGTATESKGPVYVGGEAGPVYSVYGS